LNPWTTNLGVRGSNPFGRAISRKLSMSSLPTVSAATGWSVRLGGDGGLSRGSGAGARSGSEIFGEFGVPGSGLFRDCAPRGHPFLDRSPAVVTFVRFHRAPSA